MKARIALVLFGLLGLALGCTSARAAGERSADPDPLPAPAFFGLVVDAATGAPLAGAKARFEDRLRHSKRRTTADADGLFRLDMEPWERASIRVEHPGYAWTVLETMQENSTPQLAARIRLARSARLAVRVERRGGPATGLELRVHTEAFWMRQGSWDPLSSFVSRDVSWEGEVDDSGVGVIDGLPPGVPLTVDVHESGARLRRLPEVMLESGEERELVIRIGFGCRIQGLAQGPDGTPAEGLEIWMLSGEGPFHGREGRYLTRGEAPKVVERTRVDAEGRFTFEDVSPGRWCIGPAPPRNPQPDDVPPVARVITIDERDRREELSLEIRPGLTIRGRVEGPSGEAVPYAYVHEPTVGVGDSSRDGSFTLGPLAPGLYELIASPDLRNPYADSEPVRVRAGDQDVVLRFRRGGSLSVVAHGPGGSSVIARGELLPEDFEAAGFSVRRTGRKKGGVFEFGRLVPGVYHVRAVDSFGNVGVLRDVTVEAGVQAPDRTLALSVGARVRVRVDGLREHRNLRTRIRQDGVSLGFRSLDAPLHVVPGALTVELFEYDSLTHERVLLETREVTALAGEEVEVVFDRTEER